MGRHPPAPQTYRKCSTSLVPSLWSVSPWRCPVNKGEKSSRDCSGATETPRNRRPLSSLQMSSSELVIISYPTCYRHLWVSMHVIHFGHLYKLHNASHTFPKDLKSHLKDYEKVCGCAKQWQVEQMHLACPWSMLSSRSLVFRKDLSEEPGMGCF